MTYKAIGIETGTVYATGSYPECVRLTNQQTHDEATKIIRANETYTPTTVEEETERLAKEWQLMEIRERERLEAEKAAREEARRKERKAQAKAAIEAKKQLQAELKKQTKREMAEPEIKPHKKTKGEWSSAEEAFVKTNMDMPVREMIDELEKRFGKVVTMSALNNRKYKLRNQYNLPARPAIPWTKEDDDYIIKHYHRFTAEEVGKGIGRTKGAIQARVRLLRRSGDLDYHQRYEQKQGSGSVPEPERSVGVPEGREYQDDRVGADKMNNEICPECGGPKEKEFENCMPCYNIKYDKAVEKLSKAIAEQQPQIIGPYEPPTIEILPKCRKSNQPPKTDKHIAICAELKTIYEAKNTDYGNSFAKQLEEYGLVSAAIRLEDKLNRFKHLIGNKAKADESIQDTLMDMANYAILTLIEMEEAQ